MWGILHLTLQLRGHIYKKSKHILTMRASMKELTLSWRSKTGDTATSTVPEQEGFALPLSMSLSLSVHLNKGIEQPTAVLLRIAKTDFIVQPWAPHNTPFSIMPMGASCRVIWWSSFAVSTTPDNPHFGCDDILEIWTDPVVSFLGVMDLAGMALRRGMCAWAGRNLISSRKRNITEHVRISLTAMFEPTSRSSRVQSLRQIRGGYGRIYKPHVLVGRLAFFNHRSQ